MRRPESAQCSHLPMVAVAALLAGCATAPKPDPVKPDARVAIRPVYGSSIQAVIAHEQELGLSADQVEQLSERDRELQRKLDQARTEAQASAAASAQPASDPASASPSDPASAGPPAGMGAGGGPGTGHGHHHGAPGHTPSQAPAPPSLDDRLDDLDTQSYLGAESILTEAQKEPARGFAETYREQLYDWRRSLRKPQ